MISQLLPQTLAVDAATLATSLGVSLRHLRRMEASGALGPRPLRFGRSVRYSVAEVQEWIRAGAPDRKTWQQIKTEEGDDTQKKRPGRRGNGEHGPSKT